MKLPAVCTLLLAASLFSGCESLNSLATMASDMGRSKLPAAGAQVVLAAPEGGYLGKMGGRPKNPVITLSPNVEGAETLTIVSNLAGLVYGDGKEMVLAQTDGEGKPTASRLAFVPGNRLGYVPETEAPEVYTWTIEPVHVKSNGKVYMYGDLLRLKNKATGLYLHATVNGVDLVQAKGDALWALEYVKPPAPPPAPPAQPAPAATATK